MNRYGITLLVLLAIAGNLGGAEVERSILPGDEINERIDAGDTHAYLFPLVAGTEVKAKLEAEEEEEKKQDGPAPELVLLSPVGAVLGRETSRRAEIRLVVAATGTYRLEVRAGAFEGEYELKAEVELPDSVGGSTEVSSDPAEVHLDVPVGSSVRIDVQRRSGSPPQVLAVRDGTGRELGFIVQKATRKRVRLRPVPVTAPGGLFVRVVARDGGSGSYEVNGKPTDDLDESPEDEEEHEARRLVLFLEPGADPEAVAASLGYELEEVGDGYIVVETPEDREGLEEDDSRRAADLLPEVLGAEPDALAQTPEGSQSNGVVLGSSLGRTDFDGQPGFQAIRAGPAHRRATGRGVVVAVLDTGIDAGHSLLVGRTLPGYDFVDDDPDPSEEENFLDDDGDGEIDEGFGHGTFVAGLVLGSAPDATVLPVRVLDTDARGRASDIAAGIEFAVAQGADVINLSLGARSRSEVFRGAVRFALSHGVAVVTSAGNGADTMAIDFPGGISDVIAISSLGEGGARADFANAGGRTALAAPGTGLIGPYPGERWGTWSGTSFSAALASGGAALLLERKPALRPAQVRKTLMKKARGLGRAAPKAERKLLGGGRLDLARLAR